MGQPELLASLRRKGAQQLEDIRRQAELERQRLRTDQERRLEQLREEHERHVCEACAERRGGIVDQAVRRAAVVRLRAENRLADRLLAVATASLDRLRTGDDALMLQRLAAELPVAAWGTVRVNPADAAAARSCFPNTVIVTDSGMSGGLVVSTVDGSLTVDNSFEVRLQRLWSDLLPRLVAELRSRRG